MPGAEPRGGGGRSLEEAGPGSRRALYALERGDLWRTPRVTAVCPCCRGADARTCGAGRVSFF